jgi:hypothetical protein
VRSLHDVVLHGVHTTANDSVTHVHLASVLHAGVMIAHQHDPDLEHLDYIW